jgi:hypothetical protein
LSGILAFMTITRLTISDLSFEEIGYTGESPIVIFPGEQYVKIDQMIGYAYGIVVIQERGLRTQPCQTIEDCVYFVMLCI